MVHLTNYLHMQGPRLGRKVGRPILYTGDPNAPGLTSVERQTIARRNANRHSAKRVRLRQQDELEQLQDKVNMSACSKRAQAEIM